MSKHQYKDSGIRIWKSSKNIRLLIDGIDKPLHVPRDCSLFRNLKDYMEKEEKGKGFK